MTEPRKPLVLDFLEWKTLVMHGLAEMNQAVQGSSTIDASGIAWADAKWEDIRLRLVGWENYSRPVIAEQQRRAAEQANQAERDQHQFSGTQELELTAEQVAGNAKRPLIVPQDGVALQSMAHPSEAEPTKPKRGGWPAGKPRGPRKPKAVQPPAVSL